MSAKDRSGAYLFLPDGPAKPIYNGQRPMIRHIQGPVVSEVHTLFQHVEHVTRVQNSAGMSVQVVSYTGTIYRKFPK